LAEKLFDIKLNKSATGALDSIVNVTSIQFVISQLHPLINSIKNPKSLCEVYNWIKDSVLEYGLKDINMSSLVDSLKKGFSNSNQAVRGAAISAFSILNSLSKKGLFFGLSKRFAIFGW
jgi:predicted component of type VI protein secretion system